MQLEEESDSLHQRVHAFARGVAEDTFEELALAIARFQARWSPGFRRLVSDSGSTLDGVDSIPAVPAEAFRLTRVAVHPTRLDVASFHTSGTTRSESGIHYVRRLDTYRELSVAFGRSALFSSLGSGAVVAALAPEPSEPVASSLACMMRFFMQAFAPAEARHERWLVRDNGVDLAAVHVAVAHANRSGQPLLLLATAFALVSLIDQLDGRRLECPERTLVMVTGGYKGKSRVVDPEQLRKDVADACGILPERVVGEYGMTELTSQLYEGIAPGATLAGPPGVFLPPPWLRVVPVDPISLAPVAQGASGLARFVDLGNVDSAVAIVTDDLIRATAGGVELLGRRPSSAARGCSLAVEALMTPLSDGV